jgi:protein ImuB
MAALFAERINALADPLDPGFGYDMIRLSVLVAERVEAGQARLEGGADAEGLARLVDRLGARLGPGQVRRLAAQDHHVPELAQAMRAAARPDLRGETWSAPPAEGQPLARPLRLFDRPERMSDVEAAPGHGPPLVFHWRARTRHVVAAEGPERIAPPWWQGAMPEPVRDYWRVEDEAGLRYWVFRHAEPGASAGAWFVHGLFA